MGGLFELLDIHGGMREMQDEMNTKTRIRSKTIEQIPIGPVTTDPVSPEFAALSTR